MRHWYLSHRSFRGPNYVTTTEGMIISEVPPQWREWHGRPLRDLILHLEQREEGEVFFEEIPD